MSFFRQLYQQSVTIWRSLDSRRQFLVGLCFLILLGGLLYLVVFQTTPRYKVLFANLQEGDAAEIVRRLKDAGISNKLSEDGTTILIPADRVAATRLMLAQEGLPRGGGVGYEIFNQSRLGMTSFEQRVNLKRAVEGELARTISQLKEVQWSRVQIAMPEGGLYTEQQQESTASVFLDMMPGRTLTRRQVQGVQHLVASSVEGLQPHNVMILDQYANPLAMPTEAPFETAELSSSQFELRSRVEKHFQNKLKNMFDRILGPGRSVISVSVDLDFDQIERTEERYDPENVAVRSEQQLRESTNTKSEPEGVSGIASSLPARISREPSLSRSLKESSSSTTSYEISRSVDHIIKSPSSIKGISVAVVVDGTFNEVTGPDGTVMTEYVSRTEEELEKYRRMVVAAVGAHAANAVEIINVPLSSVGAEEEGLIAAQPERRELDFALARGAVTIIALILLFLMVRFVLKRILPALPPRIPSEEIGAHVDMVAEGEADITADVKEIAESRPEEAASLIRVWLREQK